MYKFFLAISITCCLAVTAHAEIFALGDLPGGVFRSHAEGISANGTFVVGHSRSANGIEAFLWSQGGGMVGLGDLPGGGFESIASGVSDDGTVVVGGGLTVGGYNEAFRWTQSGGMNGLGFLPGTSYSGAKAGVSSDGSVVAGDCWNDGGPYRWTSSDGMVGLGDLPGGMESADARAISADGSTIVGRGTSSSGTEAFRWTQSGGMVGLGDFPGGDFDSRAYGVSADGSIIVGTGETIDGDDAFVWTASSGMTNLGRMPGYWLSRPTGVSADGSIIVGRSNGPINGGADDDAFIWTAADGMVRLEDRLIAQGDDLSHWTRLHEAVRISANGRTIIGNGTNVNGDPEAFVATLVVDVATVIPNSVSVTRGSYLSGGVIELAASDNMDLSLRRATADIQSRTEFEVKSISPVANPASLQVTLEGAVFARSQVDQTIELFDYVAAAWEHVDTRAATRFMDSTATVAAIGDLSRFVEAGTMCIEARIRYQSTNPRQQFSSNTDLFMWTIGQ